MNWVICFKKDHLRKVMCIYATKVPGENILIVCCVGPGLNSTSPHVKSKLHLNYRKSNSKATVITSIDAQVFLEVIYTAKNTVISHDFLEWKFCGKAQFPHSFGRKFPHQKIRWNYGIFRSDKTYTFMKALELLKWETMLNLLEILEDFVWNISDLYSNTYGL